MTYQISRYEEQGDRLFICINGPNTYIEHFFNEDEKADIKGAITQLIAELEIKESEFTPPEPMINKIEELSTLVITPAKIETAKLAIIADRVKAEVKEEPVEVLVEEPIEQI